MQYRLNISYFIRNLFTLFKRSFGFFLLQSMLLLSFYCQSRSWHWSLFYLNTFWTPALVSLSAWFLQLQMTSPQPPSLEGLENLLLRFNWNLEFKMSSPLLPLLPLLSCWFLSLWLENQLLSELFLLYFLLLSTQAKNKIPLQNCRVPSALWIGFQRLFTIS